MARRGSTRASSTAESAVREVYLAHYGQLAGWAGHLVGDRDLGHDLTTEAFVRLVRRWQDVDDPRPWLYATVANLAKDHWRKRGREAAAYERMHAGAGERHLDVADPGADPADLISVRDAVLSLPERLRSAVLLYYFADLSVAQVAHELGKSEGAVKRDLYDARGSLAATLEGVR